jgi:hypothetical protein
MGGHQPDDALGLAAADALACEAASDRSALDPQLAIGLTMTSMTVGSARAAAMVGPKAVRSIWRRRPCAS